MKCFKYSAVLVSMALLISATGCQKDPQIAGKPDIETLEPENPAGAHSGYVEFTLEHLVDSLSLVLNNTSYRNANGDTFTVSKFRYYLTNIELVKEDLTTWKEKESYRLIDEKVASSKFFRVDSLPNGTYRSLKFLLGVDSLRNTSGAQTGALDPANNMFWSWMQGYIFLQMEGNSPQSVSGVNGELIFHIGGFTAPYNCIREINVDFPEPVIISTDKRSKVKMACNLNELFTSPSNIKFSTLSFSMGGASSVTLANNCRDMFRILEVENE